MKTIKQILAEKKKSLSTVFPGDTVLSAMELMRERDIGAVMVVDGKKLIGIFTERDCLHKVSSLCRDPRKTLVCDVMSSKVRFVTTDMEISQCLALMTERFFRKAKISDQDFIIEQMERYISS